MPASGVCRLAARPHRKLFLSVHTQGNVGCIASPQVKLHAERREQRLSLFFNAIAQASESNAGFGHQATQRFLPFSRRKSCGCRSSTATSL
jgi:hypothetical protein